MSKYFSQNWKIVYSEKALAQLEKMDRPVQKRILDFFDKKVLGCENPRIFGKQLKGNLGDFWSYRIGDYRVITTIQDEEFVILALQIGHRKFIYQKAF